MQRIAEVAPQLVEQLAQIGARFTHHTSIAPTGTISLSLANNACNGIEPSFAHHYFRNVIRAGRKTKEKIDVFSFELLAYRELVNPRAMPGATADAEALPAYFTAADEVTPRQHVDIQAAAQKWVDSSISKTANVPTDFPYEEFKDIYLYAHEQGLKGCTTFRFNPEAFQGVLVKEEDLQEHDLRVHARGWHGDQGARRRGDRVRRREPHRRQSVRRAQRRLLREVLSMNAHQDRQAHRQVPGAEAGRAAEATRPPRRSEELAHSRDGRTAKVIRMHEEIQRPEVLIGSTYKIKTPVSDHAMYVTINDIVLNEGTEYEQRRPFEVFINSKNLDHFQWIVALTRIISAVFRKGGDVDVPGR